ncbi:MAG: sensor histidine kinase [Anaerolineae bacterium]
MRVWENPETRRLFAILAGVLLLFILVLQGGAWLAAERLKREMVRHDAGVAGYLAQNGLDETQIARAFTAERGDDATAAGARLLAAAGYSDTVETSLLPVVERFHWTLAVRTLGISLTLAALVCGVVWFFLARQCRRVARADQAVQAFMAGDVTVRLEDQEEGVLPKLFASVNGMAASQAAHIEKEHRTKEFLKDTIADISHQLKTPLAALKMYHEIMRGESNDPEVVRAFSAKSERELTRMETLIQNLLKMARLDAGAITLRREPQALRDCLEDVVGALRTRADLEGKRLELSCGHDLRLSCDEEWLREAFSNIIKNALDHTAPADVIQIVAEETPTLVQVTIQDNGSGIHPEDIHHIFQRFYRSRFSQDRQGIGIGLTLAKAIVEQHGGSITVESELGHGAAFLLAFPKLANL